MFQKFPFKFFSFFLWTGSTFAYFHILGNRPHLKKFSNIIFNGISNAASLNCIILTEIPSHPCALLGFNDLIMLNIFSSVMGKSFIREEGAGKFIGILLSVSIVVH